MARHAWQTFSCLRVFRRTQCKHCKASSEIWKLQLYYFMVRWLYSKIVCTLLTVEHCLMLWLLLKLVEEFVIITPCVPRDYKSFNSVSYISVYFWVNEQSPSDLNIYASMYRLYSKETWNVSTDRKKQQWRNFYRFKPSQRITQWSVQRPTTATSGMHALF